MRHKILISSICFLLSSIILPYDPTFNNPEFCSEFVRKVRNVFAKISFDPVFEMKEEFKKLGIDDIATSKIKDGLWDFEADVIRIIEKEAPELRRYDLFAKKWNISERAARDIVIFYGIWIYSKINFVVEPGREYEVMERLNKLSLAEFIRKRLVRYLYYKKNVTRRSVPQMAGELSGSEKTYSESDVYKELRLFDILILESFNKELGKNRADKVHKYLEKIGRPDLKTFVSADSNVLDIARQMQRLNIKESSISEILKIGEQALKYIRHYTNEKNRGVGWERAIVSNEYGIVMETEFLMLRKEAGDTYQEIAKKLNSYFSASEMDDEFRTESSVNHRASAVGLTENIDKNAKMEKPQKDWLAQILGIPDSMLNKYNQRNGRREQNVRPSTIHNISPDEISKIEDNYARQRTRVIVKILQWIKDKENKYKKIEIVTLAKVVGIESVKLTGTGKYNPNNPKARYSYLRIFDSLEDFYITLYEEGKKQNIRINLYTVSLVKAPSSRFKKIMQSEVLEIVLEWINGHKGMNFNTGELAKVIGISSSKLTGTGEYNPNNPKATLSHQRIFDSSEDFYITLYEEGKKQNIRANLCPVTLKEAPSDRFRKIMQSEALEIALEWINNHEGMDYNIKELAKVIGVNSIKLTGVGLYNPNNPKATHSHQRIFDSLEDFYITLYEEGKRQNIRVNLCSVTLMEAPSDRFRKIMQSEALEIAMKWINDHKGMDYNIEELAKVIGVNATKLTGTGKYNPNNPRVSHSHQRIFDSKEAFLDALNNKISHVPL